MQLQSKPERSRWLPRSLLNMQRRELAKRPRQQRSQDIITRRMNVHTPFTLCDAHSLLSMYLSLEPSTATVIDPRKDICAPSVESDSSVWCAVEYSVTTKVSTPRLNLVPQKGAVPCPPLGSARNHAGGHNTEVPPLTLQLSKCSLLLLQTPVPRKLSAEKAHYLLQLHDQMSNGSLRKLSQEVSDRRSNGMCISVWMLSFSCCWLWYYHQGEGIQPCVRPSSTFNGDYDIKAQSDCDYLIENSNGMPKLEDIKEDGDDEGCPTSPQAGQQHTHHDSITDHLESGKYHKAIKVKNSWGKPKADDWEPEVQDVLAEAIQSYETKLATQGFFPDHMEEVTWAKAAWLNGCRECNVKIHHNTELIKIVWFCFLAICGAN